MHHATGQNSMDWAILALGRFRTYSIFFVQPATTGTGYFLSGLVDFSGIGHCKIVIRYRFGHSYFVMKTKRKLVPKSSTIDGTRHTNDVNVVERDLCQNVCGVGNSSCFPTASPKRQCIRQLLEPMLHSDPHMYVSGMPAHVSEMLDATHGQQQPQRASTSNVNRPSISNHGLYAAEFQSFV
ncbi:hypothetical protein Tco_1029537 [Tanacetum coccineum]|uniref:Uncharacterized protein n=1 Tax=Tanacetum coccineum TaxID=301880 RepID=A0ABQ5G3X6_9ASTR